MEWSESTIKHGYVQSPGGLALRIISAGRNAGIMSERLVSKRAVVYNEMDLE